MRHAQAGLYQQFQQLRFVHDQSRRLMFRASVTPALVSGASTATI